MSPCSARVLFDLVSAGRSLFEPLAGHRAYGHRAERVAVHDAGVVRFRAGVRASRLGILRRGASRQGSGIEECARSDVRVLYLHLPCIYLFFVIACASRY